MAEITATMVRDLREKTDAPMMECKRALAEAGGDLSKAEEILRIRLGNKASKAASRITAEGAVAAYVTDDGRLGAIVEVNCETDFVAKNGEFIAFAGGAAELAAKNNPADAGALGLGVQDDLDGHRLVGGGVHVDVAIAGVVLEDGHRGFGRDAADQALAAARDGEVDAVAPPQ